jgi:Collagen triple helix repeat (20 copies)
MVVINRGGHTHMQAGIAFVKRHILAVVAIFIALGGSSYAAVSGVATPKKSKTYYACVTTTYQTLNLTTKNGKCRPGQRKISFAAEGQRGKRGLTGKTGARGVTGAAGMAGAKGADGERGPAGASVLGSPGVKGDKGDTGEAGAQGDSGLDGAVGPQGLQGDKGDAGATGAAGAKGDAGAQGLQGLKGDKGDAGSQGLKGDNGTQGLKGETGSQGLIGLQGPKGDTGSQGAKGDNGAKGDKGDAGAPGAKGDKGDAGAPGAKGDKGDPGPAGPAGGGIGLIDGNNVKLGAVVSTDRDSTTVVTATGHVIDIPWTGQFTPAQIYYTGQNCSGTAYLNDGRGGTGPFSPLLGKWVVYSGSMNTLMVPATVNNGFSMGEAMTAATIDNPTCGANAGTRSGWKLTAISRANVGLPNTIATPLRFG